MVGERNTKNVNGNAVIPGCFIKLSLPFDSYYLVAKPVQSASDVKRMKSDLHAVMSLYRVEEIPGKGVGVVACTDIARGTIIVSEAPLFTIPRLSSNPQRISDRIAQQVRNLEREQQRSFFSLCNNYKELSPFVGIVKTNAMPLGVNADSGGIFPTCSRFNHSCCSNASYSWCSKLGHEQVFAVKDIKEREEISVCYLRERFWASPRHERQQHLSEEFGFHCCCTVCSQDIEDVSASDVRRQRISQLDNAIGDGMLIVMNPDRALTSCKEVLQLLGEEGESGAMIYSAYYDAFQVCVAHGDFARASALAGLAASAKKESQGHDADGLERIEELIRSPQTHRLAGTTNRWRSKVGHARTPGSEGFEEWLWRRTG